MSISTYTPRHLDYAGMLMYTPEIGQQVEVKHARAQVCDFCDPGTPDDPNNCAADYMLDAVEVLGDGGHNVFYCEEHLLFAISHGMDAGEVWATNEGLDIRATEYLGRMYV